MKWVIKHIPDGMYAVSPRLLVYNKEFARRFSTRKQANAYIASSGFGRAEYAAEEFFSEADTAKEKEKIPASTGRNINR